MFKVRKLIFILVLSIIACTVGGTAGINPTMAKDRDYFFDDYFDDFYNDFYDDFLDKFPDDFYLDRKYFDIYKDDTSGLKGEYYGNTDFKNQKFTRIDSRISFDWGMFSPFWGTNNDNFSIRWTGQIQPAFSEKYTFHAIADDGVRLWINNELIIDEWDNKAASEYEGSIALTAKKKYNIRLDYCENKNDACIKLLWSSKSQEKEIIPRKSLSPKTGDVVKPTPKPKPTPTPTPAATSTPASSIAPVTVNLTEYFDEDAFSYDSNRSDGNYDGAGRTYPAELADTSLRYENITYKLGSMANGRNNSINCDGQVIAVDRGKYSSIRLAGSATNGAKTGAFKINYTDGSYTSFSVAMKDWCGDIASGDKVLREMDHRHNATGNNSTDCQIFAYYLDADKNKTAKSITLPDENNMHILAVTLVPSGSDTPPAESGNGLKAEYFDDADLTDPCMSRADPMVSFDWGTGAPDVNMGPNTFSVRWTGQIMPEFSETYTFYTVSDDGVRLWVNNKLLIDDWTEHPATERSGSITLKAGRKYGIKLEYYEKTDRASIKLMWSGPSRSKQIVPEARLFH